MLFSIYFQTQMALDGWYGQYHAGRLTFPESFQYPFSTVTLCMNLNKLYNFQMLLRDQISRSTQTSEDPGPRT